MERPPDRVHRGYTGRGGDWRDQPLSQQQLAQLAKDLNDESIVAKVTDAMTGQIVDRYVYRWECGHILVINVMPLPDTVTESYCPTCGRTRRIVAFLTAA